MYQIARDGAIEDRFEIVVRTGPPGITERMGGALEALVTPVPAVLLVIEPLSVIGDDPSHSYRAAVRYRDQRSMASAPRAFCGGGGLAVMAQRRSRAFALSVRDRSPGRSL